MEKTTDLSQVTVKFYHRIVSSTHRLNEGRFGTINLGYNRPFFYTMYIRVHVSSLTSERECVRSIDCVFVSVIFLLDFGIFLNVKYRFSHFITHRTGFYIVPFYYDKSFNQLNKLLQIPVITKNVAICLLYISWIINT